MAAFLCAGRFDGYFLNFYLTLTDKMVGSVKEFSQNGLQALA